MRVNRYRVWDIDHRQFIYFDLDDDDTMGDLYGRHGIFQNGGFGEKHQFCGLVDKNGKEIYEGDVVRVKNYADVESILEVRFGLHSVGYDGDCAICATGLGFHFKWLSGGRDFLGIPYMEHLGREFSQAYLGVEVDWDGVLEVIGNIYENSSLLEEDKE